MGSTQTKTLKPATRRDRSKSLSLGPAAKPSRSVPGPRSLRRQLYTAENTPIPRSSYAKRERHLELLQNSDLKSTIRRIRSITHPSRSRLSNSTGSHSSASTPGHTPSASPKHSVSSHTSFSTDESSRDSSPTRMRYYSVDQIQEVDLVLKTFPRYERKFRGGRKRAHTDLRRSRHSSKRKHSYYHHSAKKPHTKRSLSYNTSDLVTDLILEYLGGEFDHIHLKPAPRHILRAKNEKWLATVLARKEVHAYLKSLVSVLDKYKDLRVVTNFRPNLDFSQSNLFSSRSCSLRSMDCESSVSTATSDCVKMELSSTRDSCRSKRSSSRSSRFTHDNLEHEIELEIEVDGDSVHNV